ncbi:MAG: 4-(cytidine 5'-diphospho)-2-C-methyl-D-erythritol kinase [Phenylobacterium sp.]|uniref:4-(cytidine 5'-diphospho)-2-C-methyl-D-erythritol kinase n=1 Tax=Phenylobacterium sp. TaxID=1871053 RepID=UPI00271FBF8F|nr:4-(cytidine 5'-diphospho)-2-C-methyl-D-erythritol kinase [Phenylobacterium sp.]MDO8900472.1 4-(cytidine 5'-diphospho)-2-C-methyl-D-erythritol kinase [Phenylobacterium sp.]MDP2213790.1 4-(cytidine 5'-diphospho)-2-C-methyl-D-erythritol kinase [Phenylobacterium sp.]
MLGQAFAPAKVNLFLHVGAPAADGYHPLCSLMVFADVGDRVSIAPAEALDFALTGPFGRELSAQAGDNLVQRAAQALLKQVRGPRAPVLLALDKQLPIAAGLGGGSSDAGAALRLLRTTWAPELSDENLQAIAGALGADGAACLWGAPVMAEGRGEVLSQPPALPVIPAVLVNPRALAPTAQVYGRYDALGQFGDVVPPAAPAAFETVEELAGWLSLQRNDLEAAAIELTPEIGDVLAALSGERETLLARMSGSGATCFAICGSDIEAEQLAEGVERLRPDWWVSRCRLGGPWPDPA